MERIINALKKDVDAGLLTAAKAVVLGKADVAEVSAAKGRIFSDNELNHIRCHITAYARQQEAVKQSQTVLGLLAVTYPAATARLLEEGKIMVCLAGEKPLDPDDTGIIIRKLEGEKL